MSSFRTKQPLPEFGRDFALYFALCTLLHSAACVLSDLFDRKLDCQGIQIIFALHIGKLRFCLVGTKFTMYLFSLANRHHYFRENKDKAHCIGCRFDSGCNHLPSCRDKHLDRDSCLLTRPFSACISVSFRRREN